MPEEAQGVLAYMKRCAKGEPPQQAGKNAGLWEWVGSCLAFERGRR